MSDRFICASSEKFVPLVGEDEELFTPGTYGKAVAEYLRTALIELGYDAPFTCVEDWGWWVELKGFPFRFGVCIYANLEEETPKEYAVTSGALKKKQYFSILSCRWIDPEPAIDRLNADLKKIFEGDPAVEYRGEHDAYPF